MTTGIYHQNHGRISVFGCLAFWARLIVSIHCQCLSRKILKLTAQTIGAFINTKKNHQLSMLIFSCTFFNTFQPTQPIQADDSTTVAASLFNISARDVVSFCSERKCFISKFSELIHWEPHKSCGKMGSSQNSHFLTTMLPLII
jgi:hypothetical protein